MATKNKNDHTKKIDKNQQGRSPTVPATATIKNNKDRQGQQQPTVLHTPQIPLSSPPSYIYRRRTNCEPENNR